MINMIHNVIYLYCNYIRIGKISPTYSIDDKEKLYYKTLLTENYYLS